MSNVVIVCANRTPLGAYNGQLQRFKAQELGAYAISGLMQKLESLPLIDSVIMGCVIQSGLGQSPARQAALLAKLPINTPCSTTNKVCGSAMRAVMAGFDAIKSGRLKSVIAGGMESMTNAPYLLEKARFGYRVGHHLMIDAMYRDGLEDAFSKNAKGDNTLMGEFADATAKKYNFSREDQELFAAQTYEYYQSALDYFSNEITSISVMDNKGNEAVYDKDEPPLKVNPQKFQALRPAFGKDGTVTAATSSSLADGAAALLLMDEDEALAKGFKPLARIINVSEYAHEPEWFTTAPIGAIKKIYQDTGWTTKDVDLFEVNEAFAVVPMAAMHELNIERSKMNAFGGACTMGHPIGCSGARVVVTLLNALKVKGLKRGIAAVCIGSGEATALAIELV